MTNAMALQEKGKIDARSSPTSIIDYPHDDSNSTSSHDGLYGLLLDCETEIENEREIIRSNSSRSRRSARTLPTLEEEAPDSPKKTASTTNISMPLDLPMVVAKVNDPDEEALDHAEIRFLNNKASAHALRGNEEEAIKVYKKALRLTRVEVARINKQLQRSKNNEKYVKTTLHIILHDEWTQVALIIADIRTMMAILYERLGDYERAVMCCNEARDVYERQSKIDKKRKNENVFASEMMERMNHMTSKMEDAKDTYPTRKQLHEDSVETHRQICVTPDPAVRDLLYEALFDKLSAALGLELESLGRNHPQVADTMAFLSKLYHERSEVEKALKSMAKAVAISEVSLGRMHPRTGEKYRDIARMYEDNHRDNKDIFNAILFYEKAIQAFTDAEGNYSLVLGSILNDVGVLHIQCQQYDLAVEKLSDALAMYESCTDDRGGVFADTVQVWRNLAECYVLRKEWGSASMAFKSALNVQRDARKMYDASVQGGAKNQVMPMLITDESIADTLRRLGKSLAAQQKYDQSFGTLLEALTLLQNAYDKVQTPDKQDQVANVLYCIAEVKESDKKYGDAIRLYEESLQLRRASDKLRPKGKKMNYVHCGMCLAGIGSCQMARKEYNEAFKAYNKAIQCTRSEKLPEFHPIVQMLWDKSRTAARKMGQISILEKRLSQSTSSGDSTIDSMGYQNQAQKPPPGEKGRTGQTSSWFYTVTRLQKKVLAHKKRGDFDGAIESSKIILELRRAAQAKKVQSKRPCIKEQRHVASTLVSLAQLVLIKDSIDEAETYFKEAEEIYKSSGLTKEDDTLQEISRELERLRWQKKTANHKK